MYHFNLSILLLCRKQILYIDLIRLVYEIVNLHWLKYKYKYIYIYTIFILQNLAAERTYNNLDVTLKQANEHRSDWFEGVQKCHLTDTLFNVIEKIVRAEVSIILLNFYVNLISD